MAEMIRPAHIKDAPEIARVHIDTWRTAYKGIVPDHFLANMSYERPEQYWTKQLNDIERKTFEHVALDEQGNVVGFVSGGPERTADSVYKGELYAIYVLQNFQGRDLGRRLVRALAEDLVHAGLHSMLLWVLVENPARHFYEALGGQELRMQTIEIGGAVLEEVAYGWLDIRTLLPESAI